MRDYLNSIMFDIKVRTSEAIQNGDEVLHYNIYLDEQGFGLDEFAKVLKEELSKDECKYSIDINKETEIITLHLSIVNYEKEQQECINKYTEKQNHKLNIYDRVKKMGESILDLSITIVFFTSILLCYLYLTNIIPTNSNILVITILIDPIMILIRCYFSLYISTKIAKERKNTRFYIKKLIKENGIYYLVPKNYFIIGNEDVPGLWK